MKQLSDFVKGVSSILDRLAGICIFCVMLLVVSNIILRAVFKHPVLGTYEIVGYLTALAIGFALAQCAMQNGHIAVSFITERFPQKMQSLVDLLITAVSLVFWTAAVWYLVELGQAMKMKGLVSASAEIPVFPIVYLVASGLLGLCLVLLFKLLVSFREVVGYLSLGRLSLGLKSPDTARRY